MRYTALALLMVTSSIVICKDTEKYTYSEQELRELEPPTTPLTEELKQRLEDMGLLNDSNMADH